MSIIRDFVIQFDKQAIRAIAVLLAMFLTVIIIVLLGREMVSLPESEFSKVFEQVRASGFGLPITIFIFILAAFLGIPQWALIAGVMVAFGPMNGAIYSWTATLCSASFDFWLGRWLGADRLRRYGGELINRIIEVVRENGFLTSFAIRFVPTGPFILVNLAAGVAQMKFMSFVFGTGLGIIPKIAVVALIAQGILSSAEGKKITLVFIGCAIALIVAMFFTRKWLNKKSDHNP